MAKTYLLPAVATPAGTLNLSFINDDGVGTTALPDNMLISHFDTLEKVEETGIGGIVHIGQVDVELYDRNNLLQTAVLNKNLITKCNLRATLTVGGIEYPLHFGPIDLTTIDEPSYYDNQTGTEAHSTKLTAFSFLRGLEERTVETLKTAIGANPNLLSDFSTQTTCGFNKFVKIMDVLDEIQKLLGVTTSTPVVNVSQTFEHTGLTAVAFAALYLLWTFDFTSACTALATADLWFPPGTVISPSSFVQLNECRSFLTALAGQFCCYPLLIHTPSTDTFHLELRQRNSGTLLSGSEFGLLKKSTRRTFYGYNAIRVQNYQPLSAATLDKAVSPATITDPYFDLVKQKFDYRTNLTLSAFPALHAGEVFNQQTSPFLNEILHPAELDENHFRIIDKIKDSALAGTPYTSWNRWLLDKFISFWGNPSNQTTNPAMYDRTYQGVGIGATPVQVLDRIPIVDLINPGGKNYSIIEIKRRIMENEMTVKAVQFS